MGLNLKKNKWKWLIILASTVPYTVLVADYSGDFLIDIAYILGTITMLLVSPAIIAVLPALIYGLITKKMASIPFMYIYICGWVVIFLLTVRGYFVG